MICSQVSRRKVDAMPFARVLAELTDRMQGLAGMRSARRCEEGRQGEAPLGPKEFFPSPSVGIPRSGRSHAPTIHSPSPSHLPPAAVAREQLREHRAPRATERAGARSRACLLPGEGFGWGGSGVWGSRCPRERGRGEKRLGPDGVFPRPFSLGPQRGRHLLICSFTGAFGSSFGSL
jgi:hypothetical protein